MGQREKINVAFGEKKADLVLKNARIVNVFTNELEKADIAIHEGYIVGIGDYNGDNELDLDGATVCPGLIDGHIHLESSMLAPSEFARTVVPHGTTTVITDPHEIANVVGTVGIDYMLKASEDLPLDIFFMLPSCVPATDMDESGAELRSETLKRYYNNDRVLGLAELMNAFGTVRADEEILRKIADAKAEGKIIDGHAPGLTANELCAYVVAGVTSDHECSTAAEGMEKIKRGQWVMIREGTAAKNLKALLPLFGKKYYGRCMLVTDDKHPGDLLTQGHIDYIIREAVRRGENPIYAIRMASFNAAQYFGLKDRGAIAPGYRADLLIIDNLESFQVRSVYKDGKLVATNGVLLEEIMPVELPEDIAEKVIHSFHMDELKPSDIQLEQTGKFKRVIGLTDELLTKELIVPNEPHEDFSVAKGVQLDRNIVKLVVAERHRNTGHIGIGFVYNYGIKKGAIASSIAHDSHNLIVIGTNDEDICLAANTVRENQGGLAVVANGVVLGELAMPIAGLMCEMDAEQVEERMTQLKETCRELGISRTIDPFMTLAFISLPVIPSLRLTTFGLFDTTAYKLVPVLFD